MTGPSSGPSAARLSSSGPRHFGQLRDQIDGISEKMLTQTLRSLERDGLVARHPGQDRTVSYQLTPLG
jgi:DNA-binding HxlR family transcriptional regulator